MAHPAANTRPAALTDRATRRSLLAGLATLPLAVPAARAQRGFPDRPVRLIVPYGPGTATETIARQVSASVPAFLGQPVVIENRGGASGAIGAEAVARSAPDGHTLLFGTDQVLCLNPALFRRLPYDAARDFVPVAGVASLTYLLVVAPDLPARTVPELVALAKAQPGQLTFASTGVGAGSHLIGETFQREAGIELTYVPYPAGAGQLFADLMTGKVSMMFYAFGAVRLHLEAGRMRALATAGTERPAWMPDLPSLREHGYPGATSAAWFGVYAPAGTPEDRISRLSDAFRQAMDDPGLQAVMRDGGADLRYRLPAEVAAFNAAERDRCREQVALSGAAVN